jgi:hypothetical protein
LTIPPKLLSGCVGVRRTNQKTGPIRNTECHRSALSTMALGMQFVYEFSFGDWWPPLKRRRRRTQGHVVNQPD